MNFVLYHNTIVNIGVNLIAILFMSLGAANKFIKYCILAFFIDFLFIFSNRFL